MVGITECNFRHVQWFSLLPWWLFGIFPNSEKVVKARVAEVCNCFMFGFVKASPLSGLANHESG